MLTLALSKGRLLTPSVAFLKALKMLPEGFSDGGRSLVFDFPKYGLRILLLRASDVPTYVEYGAADMGIVGSDLLMEQMRDVYEPVDLGFGRCRLVLAALADSIKQPRVPKRAHLKPRVATKYPNITERYFSERGLPIEIVKLYGSIEIAPLVGVSDQIVDLSATGETLRAHGLAVVDQIADCSARLIVNRASHKIKYPALLKKVEAIKHGVASGKIPLP